MIDRLVSGKLYGKPIERTGQSGKPFVTAKLRVPQESGESLLVSAIAFSEPARRALLALDDGDSIAIAGPLTVGTFDDKEGKTRPSLSLVAHVVATPYHVRRKRAAIENEPEE